MKFKNIMAITFLLVVVLSLGAVAASDDNATSDTLTVENDFEGDVQESLLQDNSIPDDEPVLGENSTPAPKTTPEISIEVSNVNCGDDVTVYVHLSSSIGYVQLIVKDSEDQTVDNMSKGISLGECRFLISGLPAGNYSATASYTGGSIYNPANATKGFTVSKITPIIGVNASDVNYRDDVTVYVNLPSDATGNVVFIVNGFEISKEISLGECSFLIHDLQAGEYDASVSYTGDSNYNPTTSIAKFAVSKVTPECNFSYYDGHLMAYLPSDATGEVVFNVGDEMFNAALVNGFADYEFELPHGINEVIVRYPGDSNYEPYTFGGNISVRSPTSFEALQQEIDDAVSSLVLSKDYRGYGYKIIINKPFTLDGNGHTLDAKGLSQILSIESADVIIKNIIFSNASSSLNGGALSVTQDGCTITECAFINCTSESNGGAVSFEGNSDKIIKSSFINCSASNGGAVYCTGTDGTINSSTFTDCSAQSDALGSSADEILGAPGSYSGYGGSIYITGDRCQVILNLFNGSTSVKGGSIYISGRNSLVNSSYFNISYAYEDGGVIYLAGEDGLINNSHFEHSKAMNTGGAIRVVAINAVIADSEFVECSSHDGGAIYGEESTTVSNSIFKDNFAVNGGAIYDCVYKDCTIESDIYPQLYPLLDTFMVVNSLVTGRDVRVLAVLENDTIGNVTFTIYDAEGEFVGAETVNIVNGTANHTFIGLNLGNYVVIGNYTGGGNYKGQDNMTAFTVEKFKSTVEISPVPSSIRYGESFDITVTNNTQVTVKINNVEYRLDSEGKVIVDVSKFPVGTYTISATIEENDMRWGNSSSAVFKVIKAVPTVSIIPNLDTGFVELTFPACDKTVTFTIGGETFNFTADKGSKTIDLRTFPAQNHNYELIYPETDIYESRTVTGNVTLYKTLPFAIEISNIVLGEALNITVTVPDNLSGMVNFTFNTDSQSVNKTFSKLYPNLAVGHYQIGLAYEGDSKYYKYAMNETFTVIPIITATKSVIFGDSFNVYADLGNVEGYFAVYINGKVCSGNSIDDVIKFNQSISSKKNSAGNHTLTFSFENEQLTYWDSKTGRFLPIECTLEILPKELKVIPKKMVSNDNSVITLEFPDDAEGTLTIYVDGVKDEVVKVVGGIMNLDMSKYKGENHIITFEYSGDSKYLPFKEQSSATIYQKARIGAGDLTKLYTSKKTYSVTVYGIDGKISKGTSVVFLINNRAIGTVKTDAKGVATISVSKNPGKYSITSKALGVSATKTLKINSVVTLKAVKVKASAKKLVLTATVKKVDGKYLKGKVIFKFNGKKLTGKINKKGVAKVTVSKSVLKKLKAGKKVTYQATYLKDTVKKSVKVKK